MTCLNRHVTSNFLKADFHKFYLVYSRMPCLIHLVLEFLAFEYKNSINILGKVTRNKKVREQKRYFWSRSQEKCKKD